MFLGVNTSLSPYVISVGSVAELSHSQSFHARAFQVEFLQEAIDDVLGRSGVTLSDIRAIVGVMGPGNYTGLRVGLSVLKSLSMVHQLPIYGVETMEALSKSVPVMPKAILTVAPSVFGEVNMALWVGSSMDWRRLTPTHSYPYEAVGNLLKKFNTEVGVFGQIPSKLSEIFEAGSFSHVSVQDTPISAEALIKIAETRYNRGEDSEYETLVPTYSHLAVR